MKRHNHKELFYEEKVFCTWIENNKLMTAKGARSVLSRLKRLSKYIDIFSPESTEQLIAKLNLHLKKDGILPSVQPQLRRALKLFREFISE